MNAKRDNMETQLTETNSGEQEIARLKALLLKASKLASIASDWNLGEVEIDGKWVSCTSLARKFKKASK